MPCRRPAVLAALAALACEREHKTLVSKEGCESPEIVRCLQDYAYEELTSEGNRRLRDERLPRCWSSGHAPRPLSQRRIKSEAAR